MGWNGIRSRPFIAALSLFTVISILTGIFVIYRLRLPDVAVKPPEQASVEISPRIHNAEIASRLPAKRIVPGAIDTPVMATPRMTITPPIPPSGASVIRTGIAGTHISVAHASMKPERISMKNISLAETDLSDVARSVTLGGTSVKPLPRGEPGGRVVGRGRDIEGVFRLVRVQHSLADWWADQSSLVALDQWMNKHTRIRTDMGVEGGSLRLTDPMISKAPLLFFTGHDPALVRSRGLGKGPITSRLSEQERDALRRYLVEDGGFLYLDDCGVTAPAESFTRLMLAQLRYAMPEYPVDRIPNDHEIYSNYYDMGGPPVGFDIFWWGTHPPRRNFLEGITIDDELRALVCRKDYMCAMETVSLPTRTVQYSPGVYRFSTNVAIYALTHGRISDYSRYAPEDRSNEGDSIEEPTIVPKLE